MSSTSDISKWLEKNLQDLLPCLVTQDVIECITKFENDRDLEAYLSTFVDLSNPKYKVFMSNFKRIRSVRDVKDDEDTEKYNKKLKDLDKKTKKGNNEVNLKGKKNNSVSVSQSDTIKDKDEKQLVQKKKTKFINLYSAQGEQKDVILLKGRHFCECQASKHGLINNCLKCGRIVCEQEGSGPCLFCHNWVFTKDEKNVINSNSKMSRKLYNSINESFKSEDLDQAMERRDRLLDCDRSAAQKTKVIDDEGEYFSTNSAWLSKEERQRLERKEAEVHAKKHASRLQKKFTFDFAGRVVVEEENEEYGEEYYTSALNKIEETLTESYPHPDISFGVQPLYQDTVDVGDDSEASKQYNNFKSENKVGIYKVQDREFLEMSDNGVCLSIHQPWASLLVSGIMRYEGRSWYTSHRGRLWIASTSKTPKQEDIKDAENFFREVRANENLNFPKSYPSGCLLGCVSIIDCLPQEEFRQKYPDGECDSPFVLVCEDARLLDILFPISGSHKIYKLDAKIHHAANKALLRLAKQLNGGGAAKSQVLGEQN